MWKRTGNIRLNRTIFPRLIAFLLFLFAFAASAVDLNVSVQPRNLTVGMRGYIEISAENVSRLQVNRMPGRVSGIEWNSGISSGSSMSVINGVTSSKYTLRIPFTAREEGDFTIPSFEVIVNGNTRQPESAGPVRIRISAMPKIDPSQVNSNEPVYARMTFPGVAEDKKPAFWVGEEIPLQLSIFVRTPYELRLANYPEIKSANGKMSIRFHDFRKINPEAPNYESITSHNQRLGNIPYTVYDFDTKFRALAPGQLQLVADTAAILLDERDFFSAFTTTRQTIRGASPEITIKPLPAAPSDAPFVGLIGKWAPEASLSPGPYRIGEPLSLKVNFTGEDQTEMLNMPKIEPEHFRAYPPETAETSSGVSVSCILIPLEEGEQTISFNCSTFDPSTGQYVPFKFKETIKVDKAVSGGIAAIPAKQKEMVAKYSAGLPQETVPFLARLAAMLDCCRRHRVRVIADEIHHDLILPGHTHVSAASLWEGEGKPITFFSASKTFNLAGMKNSILMLPDADLRQRFDDFEAALGGGGCSTLDYVAVTAAFEGDEALLESLIEKIK